jgi:betaine-aldehyde dehydrogenase
MSSPRVPTQLFIDGQCRAAADGAVTPLINPATEETFAEVAAAGVKEADEAMLGAQKAFANGWRDLAPGRRAEILYKISAALTEHAEEVAQLETLSVGKPISDSRDEVAMGAKTFAYYAGAIAHFGGETIPVGRGGFDFTLRQPMGVVAAIVPWNFPFAIATWKVAPALAAGNCVVLKPARYSPLTALRLGELAAEAGLPPGVLQVLPGAGEKTGDALVQHPLTRKISFTGSTAVGARIMESAARSIKRVSLELGGKSPNIIFADADWEKAAATSPMSVFANAGQDCCARSRVFIERPIFEKFVDRFVEATRKISVGDPTLPETQIGPLVSARQRESVEAYLPTLQTPHLRVLCGGQRPSGRGFYLTSTVVIGAAPTDRIWREEIFGPVVCLRPFDQEDALLAEVNDTPYGLSGSIWTNDVKRALRISRRVESGVLSINCHNSVHLEAPFGGFKQSGLGRDLGRAALEGFTEVKNIYVAE